MRMKLTKYISVLVTTLLVFFVVWIIFCVANTKVYKTVNNVNELDVPADIGWTSFISLIVLCFFFISSILGITWYSIKIMFRFYKEKSLWKISERSIFSRCPLQFIYYQVFTKKIFWCAKIGIFAY